MKDTVILPIPQNIIIPKNLVLYKENEKKNTEWDVAYSIGNQIVLPDLSSRYGITDLFKKLYLPKNQELISKGIVPEELSPVCKIVPNTPFHPRIRGIEPEEIDSLTDDEFFIDFYDPTRQINLHLISGEISKTIIQLGVDRGEMINEGVIGFRFDRYNYRTVKDFPWRLCIIPLSGKHYSQGIHDTDIIYNFNNGKNLPVTKKDLIPGHFYRRKGFINELYNQGTSRVAVYLGMYKFANGEHKRAPFNPGSSYTQIPVFINFEDIRTTGVGWEIWNNIEIHNFPLETILTDIPEMKPLTEENLKEIQERFEASVWSHKFWNTPGRVGNFYWVGVTLGNTLSQFVESHMTTSNNIVSKDFLTSGVNPERIGDIDILKKMGDRKGWSNDCLSSYGLFDYEKITLKITDSSKPLQIIPSGVTCKDWLGEDWVRDVSRSSLSSPTTFPTGSGLGYVTSDGKYKFDAMLEFLSCSTYSLAKGRGDVDYKFWKIADKND